MNIIKELKKDILTMSFKAQVGHIPSALSMVEYLFYIFKECVNPLSNKVILGKPFGAQAYYAVFAKMGWISPDWDLYGSENKNWTYCMSRENNLITFIDDTMGNTLSVACGLAIASKKTTYLNISDASLQTGSVWEAIMFAGAKKQNNILLTIDNNNMQVLGKTSDIINVEPLSEKFKLFGWNVFSVDGHNSISINKAIKEFKKKSNTKPSVIIFNTIKGKGISFMENNSKWHYKTLTSDLYQEALNELK